MRIIEIEKYFKDKESAEAFVAILKDRLKDGFCLIASGNEVVGVAVNEEFVRTAIYQKLMKG